MLGNKRDYSTFKLDILMIFILILSSLFFVDVFNQANSVDIIQATSFKKEAGRAESIELPKYKGAHAYSLKTVGAKV